MKFWVSLLLLTFANLNLFAQTSKPIKIIVPFAVGGASDSYTRIVAQKIIEQTGKSVVIDNKTGAGGRIAFDYVAHSAPDGSTVVLIDATYAMLPGMFTNLTWNVATDLVPVVMIAQTPFVVLVRTDSKFQNLGEMIAYARAHPGELNYGSAGLGSTNHIVTERFKSDAHIEVTHVPFRGMSEASLALQSGNLDFIIAASSTALSQIKGGKLKPLAVSTLKRSLILPNVPTAIEAGVPGFVTSNWFALAVPKGSSNEIINTLRDDVTRAISDSDTKDKLLLQGADAPRISGEELAKFLRDDTAKWTEVIKINHIKIDP